MRQYEASNIRNVAVVGHGSSGKTSLVEALLYRTGATDRLGKVADGTTVSDFDPEEIKRKASLNLSIVPIEYNNVKINLLDAPGLFDFALGQAEALRAEAVEQHAGGAVETPRLPIDAVGPVGDAEHRGGLLVTDLGVLRQQRDDLAGVRVRVLMRCAGHGASFGRGGSSRRRSPGPRRARRGRRGGRGRRRG